MPDRDEYRTHLSLAFDIDPAQAEYFTKVDASLTKARELDPCDISQMIEGQEIDYSNPDMIGHVLVGLGEDPGVVIEVAPDNKSVWISDRLDGDASVAGTAEIIQGGLQVSNDPGIVGFEYASTCTEPRLDGFGGGAVAVGAEQIKIMSTFAMVDRLITDVKNERIQAAMPPSSIGDEKTFSSSVPYEDAEDDDSVSSVFEMDMPEEDDDDDTGEED